MKPKLLRIIAIFLNKIIVVILFISLNQLLTLSIQAQSILLSEGFESGISNVWEQQYANSNSSEIVKSPVRSGSSALKTYLHRNDPQVKNGTRAEIKIKGKDGNEGSVRWYGFSIYLPSDYAVDAISEVLSQWHQDAGFGNPTFAFRTQGSQWKITGKLGKLHVSPDQTRWIDYWSGALQRGRWTDWVVNIKWSGKSDGFLKIWKDGTQIVNYTGPTKYEDDGVASWKLGIYKAGWNGNSDNLAGPQSRTVYHDEIKIGDANSNYEAIKPGSNPMESNIGPLVSLTTPIDNATFAVPASIAITASASDSDGSVSKVEFYNGSDLLTTELQSPYEWKWANIPAGTYAITAKATDNDGKATVSKPITITITGSGSEDDEYIVDNTDAGFSTTGTWTVSTGLLGFWNTNYLHDGGKGSNTTDQAKWASPIQATGLYDVYMRWTSQTDRPEAAPVEVNYSGGVANLTVNQKNGGGTWVKIGTWGFEAGTGNYVTIKASDLGYTIADAVRWVAVGNSSARIESLESPLSSKKSFSIMPNPSIGLTKIKLHSDQAGNAHILLFDQLGQSRLTLNKVVSPGENEIEFNVENLSSGLYSIKITLGSKTMIQNLIKN